MRGGPPAPKGGEQTDTSPGFFGDLPPGVFVLARSTIAIPSVAELLPGPLSSLADECALDGRVDRVEAAASPDELIVQIEGDLDVAAIRCALDRLGQGSAESLGARTVRITMDARTALGPLRSSSPPVATELAERVESLSGEAPFALAARIGLTRIEVAADPEHIGLRLQLPQGRAAAAEAWWQGPARAALGPEQPTEGVSVRAVGDELSIDITTPDGLAAVALASRLRADVLESFRIPSASMSPTLWVGDHLFVDKTPAPPRRGDIVLFPSPESPHSQFIKRILGMPGDTIELIDGHPIVGGTPVTECHVGRLERADDDGPPQEIYLETVDRRSYLVTYDARDSARACKVSTDCTPPDVCRAGRCGVLKGPYRVGPGEVFVVGDSRDNSHDSRSFDAGRGKGVPIASLQGRASVVYLARTPEGDLDPVRMLSDSSGAPVLPSTAPADLRLGLERCLAKTPGG